MREKQEDWAEAASPLKMKTRMRSIKVHDEEECATKYIIRNKAMRHAEALEARILPLPSPRDQSEVA